MKNLKILKRTAGLLVAGALVFGLAGCGAEETSTNNASAEAEPTEVEQTSDSNELIVYFSWSGHTEAVANEIQSQTGADFFEIVSEEAYTDNYDTLLDVAQEEQSADARPAISGSVEKFDSYDVVYLGYPIWWGDMPMIMYSFLDEYDFSGKTIVPFVTSGGSGFSDTIRTISSMEPDAVIYEGLSLGSSQAEDSANAVSQWLERIGL